MSELNCDEFVEMVTEFLDGALDSEQEREFVDHLAMCDGCDSYLEQFRRTVSTLGELPAEGVPERTRSALLAAFRDGPDTPA